MNTQTLKDSANLCNFSLALPTTNLLPTEPIQASSRDYGFDFDEDELAKELLASLPTEAANQPTPNVDTDEFCALYFLS